MTGARDGSLLTPFLDALPVDGGSITVISRNGLSSTVASSDAVATRLDALQTDLGEGPRWSAHESAAPVIVADLTEGRSRWPLFTAALIEAPVGGVFAFPLQIGYLLVGAVDLYSRTDDAVWTDQAVAHGVRAAASVARPAVRLATRSAAAGRATSGGVELHREVHQATGLLLVRLDVPPDEALALMEAYAFAENRPLLDVARDLIERRLDSDAISGSS